MANTIIGALYVSPWIICLIYEEDCIIKCILQIRKMKQGDGQLADHTLVINMRHEPQWSDFLEFSKW